MKHRIVNTSYGEVLIDMDGDCYIGDNYDQYVGTIDCVDIEHADEKTLVENVKNLFM